MFVQSGVGQVGSLSATLARRNLMQEGDINQPQGPGEKLAPRQKVGLRELEDQLRKDEIRMTAQRNSEIAQTAEQPTPEQAAVQSIVKPVNPTFHNYENKLGDFSNLVKQMYTTGGFNGISADALTLSTLDSRRPIDRILDDSGDGYSLLSNSFGLADRSEKQMKRDKKKGSKLASMVAY